MTKEKKEKVKIKNTQRKANAFQLCNTISKRENTTVELQEKYKVSYCIPPQIPIIIKPPTFMKDITSCFNRIMIT